MAHLEQSEVGVILHILPAQGLRGAIISKATLKGDRICKLGQVLS